MPRYFLCEPMELVFAANSPERAMTRALAQSRRTWVDPTAPLDFNCWTEELTEADYLRYRVTRPARRGEVIREFQDRPPANYTLIYFPD